MPKQRKAKDAPKAEALTFEVPPSLAKDLDARKRVATQVCEMIDASNVHMAAFEERWSQVDRHYKNNPEESLTPPWPDAPTYHVPVVQPRLDNGVAYVAGPMTEADPYFIVRAGGSTAMRAEPVETALQMFLHRAFYSFYLRIGLGIVQRRGKAILRPTFKPGRDIGEGLRAPATIEIDVFDPRDFAIYPTSAERIEKARYTGTRATLRVAEVRQAQLLGSLFSEPQLMGGDIAALGNQSGQEKSPNYDNSITPDDSPIDIWDGVVMMDLDEDGIEEGYQVVVAHTQRELLKMEPYQCSRPWHFDLMFQQETGSFLNENSRGHNLIGPQQFTNDSLNMTVWLSMYKGMPPVFATGWALPDDVTQTRPGQVIPVEKGGQIIPVPAAFDMAAWPELLQFGRQMSDDVSRIGGQGLGSTLRNGPTTATEAQQAAQGQQIGVSDDAAWTAMGLEQMAGFILELLYWNFDEWYPDYQESLPDLTQEDFGKMFWVSVNGEQPLLSPMAVAQQITALSQALMMFYQMDPTMRMKYPELPSELLRSLIEASSLPNKDKILPTREQEASMMQMAMAGGTNGPMGSGGPAGPPGAVQQPGMGAPAPPMAAPPGQGQ